MVSTREAIAVLTGCVVLWAVVSARAERFNITAPMAFIAFGALMANGPTAVLDIEPSSTVVRSVVEITLAILLFADASRLNLRALRGDLALPARLLGIGLPLSIGLGFLAAMLLFPDVDLWVVALIATAVAPTDAALGAPVVDDRRVPGRIRRTLNLESGLNDGIATPLVSFFIAGAVAADIATHSDTGPGAALKELAIGVVGGVILGVVVGWLVELARRRGWASPRYIPIGLLALSLLAYAATVEADGNGFVAAFVGGLAFGAITRRAETEAVEFIAGAGELLSIVVWFVFGALLVPVLGDASWKDVVFAVLSLTVVRLVAVGRCAARDWARPADGRLRGLVRTTRTCVGGLRAARLRRPRNGRRPHRSGRDLHDGPDQCRGPRAVCRAARGALRRLRPTYRSSPARAGRRRTALAPVRPRSPARSGNSGHGMTREDVACNLLSPRRHRRPAP